MKKIMENLLIRSIMMGIEVFLFGFVGMNIWWNILPREEGLHGLYYYRAATWGDGICLPLLTGALYYVCNYTKQITARKKKVCIATGIGCVVIGGIIQVSWLLDENIELNWTIPKVHYFNIAGWWHMLFFMYMFGVLGKLFMQWILSNDENSNTNVGDLVLGNFIIWFSGTLFLMLHCLDDYIKKGNEDSSILIIAVILFVVVSFFLICIRTIKGKTSLQLICISVLPGIVTAAGICLFIAGKCNKLDIIVIGNFALAFIYLIPNQSSLQELFVEGIIIGSPILSAGLAMVNISGMWGRVFWGAIGVFVPIIIVYKFNERKYEKKKVYAYIASGLLVQIAAVVILFFFNLGMGVVENLVAVLAELILGALVNSIVKKNFAYVKRMEDLQKEGKISERELTSSKKSTYFLIVVSAIGALIYLVLLMQNYVQLNELYIGVNINKVDKYVIICGIFFLVLLFIMMFTKNVHIVNRKIYTLIVYISTILMYGELFILLKGIRKPLVIEFNIVDLCALILILGSSTLVAESFYSNLYRIRGICKYRNSVMLGSLVVFIGCILNVSVCIFPVRNVMASEYNLIYILIGIVGLFFAVILIPWIFSRAICPPMPKTQIATTKSSEGVLQNGFLAMLIIIIIGQLPVYFMVINTDLWNTLLGLGLLVMNIYWVLEYCLVNNVEALKKRKMEAFGNKKDKVVDMELEGLEKHLQFQNVCAFSALLLYSLVPLLMTICGIVIKEDKTWEVLKQKYIPRL